MAKKTKRVRRGEVNRSQAIRDYLKKHRDAKPKEIIAALGAEGIEVSHSLVSAVKYSEQKGKATAKAGRKNAAPAASVSVADLMEAKKLADQLGGVAKAKQALDTLAKLT